MGFAKMVRELLAVFILLSGMSPTLAHAQFSQQGPKLVGTGLVSTRVGDLSVSISGDGNTAVIGRYADNDPVGGAWVFVRSGEAWSQQGPKLVGTDAVDPPLQGFSVAISADGNTAIVGGPHDSSGVGATWVFTRSGGVWTQQAKLIGTGAIGASEQGFSVSLSGDGSTAIVGGPIDDNSADGAIGAAWVFTRTGGVWSQQAKLVGADAVGRAAQGLCVSISSDGNTALVGSINDSNNVGAAWVFVRSGGVWAQQAKLIGIDAPYSLGGGFSCSVSSDGNTTIIGRGSDEKGVGAAWVFARSGEVWNQQAKLVGTGAVGFAYQGVSVSLSGDGNTALVGWAWSTATTWVPRGCSRAQRGCGASSSPNSSVWMPPASIPSKAVLLPFPLTDTPPSWVETATTVMSAPHGSSLKCKR